MSRTPIRGRRPTAPPPARRRRTCGSPSSRRSPSRRGGAGGWRPPAPLARHRQASLHSSAGDLKIGWERYGGAADTLWFDDVALGATRIGC
ncbi:hypothetical protein [Micromonospora sp. NPDC005299]|uniref:hypothetical protein n=1 Tax=Micromonospora sp. NPDC005299 TaxID=3364231 RepID=UPI0036A47076